MTPRRIAVIGTSGAGKTVLAESISKRLGIPHVELDSLHWLENWTPNPEFRTAVEAALLGPAWVTDGNYMRQVADVTLGRADTAVWLGYGLPRLLWQVGTRTLRRLRTGEVLWNGNRETLRDQFTRYSLPWFVLTTYRRRRRSFAKLVSEYPQLQVVRMRTPAETAVWLENQPGAVPTSP